MTNVVIDMTIDFDVPGALEAELQRAIDAMGPQDIYGAFVPAYGNADAELVPADGEPSVEVESDDWFVVGRTAERLAAALRIKMGVV